MADLSKYRKKIDSKINVIISKKAVEFFRKHPDIMKSPFVREAIEEKIDRLNKFGFGVVKK